MPVKNKNRQSNSGYEGVITGLNDEEKKVLEDAGIGGGGIPTTNINTQTFQLDTSSLTAKDSYVIASMDDGEGYISYVPLQTYFFNDGYFNKEVKMQTTSHDFRLSLTSVSFQSYNNYTANTKIYNIDFTNTLDSTNTWTKLGDIKYIAIEENEMMSGESSHKYLEISGAGSTIIDISSYLNHDTGKITQDGFDLIKNNYINGKHIIITFNAEGLDIYLDLIGVFIIENEPFCFYFSFDGTSVAIDSDLNFTEKNSGTLSARSTFSDSSGKEYLSSISDNYNDNIYNILPPLPSGSSSKTYTLKAVNGVLTWVEG